MEALERAKDFIPETILIAILFGAWRRLRPGRILKFLAATREREVYHEMMEHEREMGLYWRDQAIDCRAELLKQIAARAAESGAGSTCNS